MKQTIGIFLLFVTALCYSAHNPLLPKPQKVSYGDGQFPLSLATIGFSSTPQTEDLYAANELAKILFEFTGRNVEVIKSKSPKITIEFVRVDDVDPLALPNEETGPDSRQSYKIKIAPKKVTIEAKSSVGLFYAVQTLRQMKEGIGENAFFPECEIEDWPTLVYRGFMMDMSHTQLPKIEEIKRQIDFLARWKANQYYFYSEASIELEGYPLLMADARYTKDQVRKIIEYGKTKFIDVIPNMELYGHTHDLFRLEHYADLAVVPHGSEFKPYDPRVKPIIEDWVTQIADLFPSPFFHIGFDETWLIREQAEKLNTDPEELYLKMLNQTTEMVEKQGKTPMFYADMLQKFPSIIPEVSKNSIAIPWHYSPKKDYEPLLKPFSDEGVDMVIQSALINWKWVYPAFERSFENTDLLIKVGRQYGVVGFINSGWTDDTQTMMRMSFPDLAYGSAASWQSEQMDRDNFFKHYTLAQYPPDLAEKIEKALESLLKGESLIRNVVGDTDFALFENPFTDKNLDLIENNKDKLRQGRLEVEKAQIYIRSAMAHQTDTTTLFSMLTGARMLDYIALKFMYAGEIAGFYYQLDESEDKERSLRVLGTQVTHKIHSRTQDMMDAIMELKGLLMKAWQNEYQPFRLGIGLGKYDLELHYWLKMQRRLQIIRANYEKGQELPSLESLFQ